MTDRTTVPMDELDAMKEIDTILEALDDHQKARALDWVNKKHGFSPIHAKRTTAETDKTQNASHLDLSVTTIAHQLDAKTAYEVLRAAAASLTFVHNREHFPWKDVLGEAARATGYWTKHHPSNATKALKSLRNKNVLVELANGDFALTPVAKGALATELGVT